MKMDGVTVVFMYFFMLMLGVGVVGLVGLHQNRSVTGEVVTITHESWPWDTTTIEMKTYSGGCVSVRFEGHHDFEVGRTYRITTQGVWYKQAWPSLIESSLLYTGEGAK